ncbi:MAG: hypothetical protein ACI4QL_03115 [Candidatus Fimimonas sp.]
MKTKLSCTILAVVLVFCLFAAVACNTHVCAHKCEICGKCTSDCTDEVCKDKCLGHSSHTCQHPCDVCGKCTSDCTDPACQDKCPGHEVPVYFVQEEFDNPAVDKENWDNGDVKGMHDVKDGHLILTHTGVTDYPAKGRAMQVTIDKYPYLAIKVDDLVGSNARWSVKLQLAQDSTSSRVLQNDTTQTGVLFYDLRTVEGMPQTGNVNFTLYVYILGVGSSVSIDYVRSAEVIPGVENFNEQGNITVSDGTLSFVNGTMTVAADEGKTAIVNVPLTFPSALCNMIDVFVPNVGENSTWSLACGNVQLIDETNSYGAFGVNAAEAGVDGNLTLTISVKGEVTFDQIAALQYEQYSESFDYENDDGLLAVWKEDINNTYIELSDGAMLIVKVNEESQTATVSTTVNTNVSVYPELHVVVSELTNAKLEVRYGGKVVGEIVEAGEHSFNLIEQMMFGLRTDALSLVLVSTTSDSEATVSATVAEVSLERNATFSQGAIAPKGDRVDTEGCLNEQGNDYGNWVGDATVIARGGKLEVIQTLGQGYSKGEVYAKNVDLSVNRYLNVKIDALTSGAACKVEVIYNPQMAGEIVRTAVSEGNNVGIFTIDLYELFGLNENTKIAERVSYSIFIVGPVGAICTVDYITNNNQIDEAPVIVDVVPATSKTVAAGEQVTLSAALKLHNGNVTITVEKDGVDVTETVLNGNVFSTEVDGVYTVTYSYEGAQSVTRTITVEPASVPTISLGTEDGTVTVGESVTLQYTIANAPDGAKATITVTCDDQDVTSKVLSDEVFLATDTGVYVISFSYQGATTQTITLTVVSKWTSIDSNITISEKDGQLIILAHYDWPKAQITFNDMVINDAPYLKISIAEATNARYKIEFGDDYYGVKEVIKAEGDEKGVFYIDLRQAPYEGKFDTPQTITFYIYVIGTNQQVVVDCFEFVTEPEEEPTWTSTDSNIKISEKNGVLTLTAEYDWPKAQKTFNDMVINDAPYLKISIAEATNARYKIEFGDDYYGVKEVIKAEGSDKGVFYIDLRQAPYEGKFDTPQTITFYIYVIGTNQQVVVDCFEFVTEAEYAASQN